MNAQVLQADIADAVVQITFWTSFLFVPLVSFFWRWWRNWFGRAIVAIDILLTVAFAPTVLRIYIPAIQDEAWFTWLAIGAFGLIPVRTIVLTYVMWRVQREEKVVVETHHRLRPHKPEPAELPEPTER